MSRAVTIALALGVIAVIAAILVPWWLRKRLARGEWSAKGALRSLQQQQERFRKQVAVDLDGDKAGEYGWLGELSGAQPTPFIATALGVKDKHGCSKQGGGFFRLYLPNADGKWTPEPQKIPAKGEAKHADAREKGWRCYLWPTARGQSMNRAFYADRDSIWWTPNAGRPYSGPGDAPAADAALPTGKDTPVDGAKGRDGNVWHRYKP